MTYALALCARFGSRTAAEALFREHLRPLAARWLRSKGSFSDDHLQQVLELTLLAIRDEWDPEYPLEPWLMGFVWKRVFRARKQVPTVPLEEEHHEVLAPERDARLDQLYELRERLLAIARGGSLREAILVCGLAAGRTLEQLEADLQLSRAQAYRVLSNALEQALARLRVERPTLNLNVNLLRGLLRLEAPETTTTARRRAA